MNIKTTVTRRYQTIVDETAASFGGGRPLLPPEGWIATVRKALGMSGAQLARRLGLTRARISQAEQAERDGGVTLKTMHAMAQAMGCRFVYAIVPDGRIEDVITARAREKAQALVDRAGGHMALENQALDARQMSQEVERLTQELVRAMPSDLWTDK